jgi:hypothetical protein
LVDSHGNLNKGKNMKKNLLSNPRLAVVVTLTEEACAASRQWNYLFDDSLALYGSHGPLISGCGRDHFPEAVKDQLRSLARAASSEAAYWARPSKFHRGTINKISRLVAARDGSGFYGPRP